MNLVLDIGNTATKAAIFHEDQLLRSHIFYSITEIRHFIQQEQFDYSILSSVNTEIKEAVLEEFTPDILFDAATAVPFVNEYKTPQTLGADRIAGVMGGLTLFPDTNCLVIDAGTCVTYDFITSDKHYLGGMITPGPELKSKALNNFTSTLPLVNIEETDKLFGDTTATSILTGIINGSVAEIEGIIANYDQSYKKLQVILCGGWSKLFESKIKASIFVEPNLVLIGLNAVLKNNAKI